jgi:phosphoglycerate-specific signal transduction histidine kinase
MGRGQSGRSASTSVTSGVGNSSVVVPTTTRLEDVALHRHELEEVKKENERLRRRVRELEALVRGRRESSVSTSADELRGRTGPGAQANGV